MEVYVLVPVRKTVVAKVVGTLMLVLAVVSLLAVCLTSGITLPVALVCGIVWFVLMGNSKEFEYSYFDGEVRFAKVLNKNRRHMMTMDMELALPGSLPEVVRHLWENIRVRHRAVILWR